MPYAADVRSVPREGAGLARRRFSVTAHIDVDLGFSQRASAYTLDGKPQLSCRVFGINAPEIATDAGKAAKVYAEQTCPPGTFVTVVSHSWDKFGGRWDGSVTLPDGRDFAVAMLAAGHAVPMAG